MKRLSCVVVLVMFLASALPYSRVTESASPARDWKRVQFRAEPFPDLYLFVYKLASPSNKEVNPEGFDQAIEAARQVPLFLTSIDVIPFQFENAAEAAKAFAKYPETYKTRTGEIIPLRERAVRLGQALMAIEKPFKEKVWPQHQRLIEESLTKIELTLGPKEQECFDYFTRHLGMETAAQIVPVYLVAEMPLSGGFTMWGKDDTRGVCILNITTLKGSELIDAILHESIHALDLETKGKGNVLVELRERLLKAGFAADDVVVRHAPHMLVFIQSWETVKRHVDSSAQPYSEGVFTRPALEPLVKVELPIWTEYLDGKISRDDALTKMVSAFVKARANDAKP